jgi:hypothetical protein
MGKSEERKGEEMKDERECTYMNRDERGEET